MQARPSSAELGLEAESFDHVIANPPFHVGRRRHVVLERAESRICTPWLRRRLDVWCRFAARMAKPGGTATLIHKARSHARLLGALGKRFGALKVLPLHPRPDEPRDPGHRPGYEEARRRRFLCCRGPFCTSAAGRTPSRQARRACCGLAPALTSLIGRAFLEDSALNERRSGSPRHSLARSNSSQQRGSIADVAILARHRCPGPEAIRPHRHGYAAAARHLHTRALAGPIEKAFSISTAPSVAVVDQLAAAALPCSRASFSAASVSSLEEKEKKVYVFCEDVAASGGYYLSIAGDEIYADASSIVGSIGVISASFGLDKAIEKLGVERRVYTAGTNKGSLDPFQPEKPDDIERLKAIQRDVHDVFIGVVKERRLGRLKGPDLELFSGAFWSAPKALEFGLIDGISDVRTKMREIHGDKVRLRPVALERGWLSLSRAPFTFGPGRIGRGSGPRPCFRRGLGVRYRGSGALVALRALDHDRAGPYQPDAESSVLLQRPRSRQAPSA